MVEMLGKTRRELLSVVRLSAVAVKNLDTLRSVFLSIETQYVENLIDTRYMYTSFFVAVCNGDGESWKSL